jgi:hypothetical protein
VGIFVLKLIQNGKYMQEGYFGSNYGQKRVIMLVLRAICAWVSTPYQRVVGIMIRRQYLIH